MAYQDHHTPDALAFNELHRLNRLYREAQAMFYATQAELRSYIMSNPSEAFSLGILKIDYAKIDKLKF